MSAPPLNSDYSSGNNANNHNNDLGRVPSQASDEAPPPGYDAATAAGSSAVRREQRQANIQAEQGGSAAGRDSDVGRDERPLPEGWIKLWNSLYQHFYYVDTTSNPPRSIWTHPLDDAAFLKANPQFQDLARGARGRPSEEAGSSDAPPPPSFAPPAHAPPPQISSQRAKSSGMTRQQRIKAAGDRAAEEARSEPEPTGLKKFGRTFKENTTGKDRIARRREAAEKAEAQKIVREERKEAAQAFIRAAQTGQPQLVGTDERNGTVYYAEPPAPGVPIQMVLGSFPPPYGFESRKEGKTTYMRPAAPPMYGQRGMYGGGYGGYGMGMPLMGGMLGGALLGGMLF